ncbi:DUF2975 domain-containing protein [Flavobacterium sp. DGU11]|uniref:DUF2975 domain-containing protein n=1 Tax=Flavobacterium arundinis TaxID=3139143 RepID=A0ABU9HX27_9FLAO
MKRLPLLKTLTGILLILAIIGVFFCIPFLLIALVMPDKVPFKINGVAAASMAAEDYLLFAAEITAFGFYTYALYLFKSVLGHFEKKQIFHEKVITLLDQTGKAILIGFFIKIGSEFLYNTIILGRFNINFNSDTLFVLILGLFFMVLSEVFQMAKDIKEENDLTV